MEAPLEKGSSEQICIVIPCYNEAERMPSGEIIGFMERNTEFLLCMVNDCSTDHTLDLLYDIERKFSGKVIVLNLKKNMGKAEAVRQGVRESLSQFRFSHIGYFDADLSTPLEECIRLKESLASKPTFEFSFGSRLAIVGSKIERKMYRHLLGRIVATLISNILGLKVYDTQCGAKLFTRGLAEKLFLDPFVTTWLFDVEIFARIIGLYGRKNVDSLMTEIPLISWIDKGGSKIKLSYAFKVLPDLCRIRKRYSSFLK